MLLLQVRQKLLPLSSIEERHSLHPLSSHIIRLSPCGLSPLPKAVPDLPLNILQLQHLVDSLLPGQFLSLVALPPYRLPIWSPFPIRPRIPAHRFPHLAPFLPYRVGMEAASFLFVESGLYIGAMLFIFSFAARLMLSAIVMQPHLRGEVVPNTCPQPMCLGDGEGDLHNASILLPCMVMPPGRYPVY